MGVSHTFLCLLKIGVPNGLHNGDAACSQLDERSIGAFKQFIQQAAIDA
jgi:hypothetical protein